MESNLKITVESPASWSRRLTITVPAEQLEREKQNTTRKLAQRIKLPGFRKGKVPAQVLEKRFGPAIEQETVERVIGEAYREAIKQEKLRPVSEPEVDRIDYESGSDLTFHVGIEVQPEIELNRLGGFTIRKQIEPVADEAVDRVIQRLREQHALWTPVQDDTPVVGDMVVVEIAPVEDGEPGTPRRYQIFLGEGQVRPEIEEHIRALKPGTSGEFDVELPEDADDPGSPTRAHRLQIHVVEARRPAFPPLDDEFAKSLGDFEELAQLRERVRHDLEQESEAQASRHGQQQLLDQILEANPFEVPESFVTRYLEQVIRPRKQDDPAKVAELRETARPAARQAIRRLLVIQRIAELEGLHPTQDELDARYEQLAARHGHSAREIRAQLKKEGRDREVEAQLTEEKVFRYLESLSTIE